MQYQPNPIVPAVRSQATMPPVQQKPGVSPGVAALMRPEPKPGIPPANDLGARQAPPVGPVTPPRPNPFGSQNTGVPTATLRAAQAQPGMPQMPVQPQAKPMAMPQQSISQQQAALVNQIANRPGISPAVRALMAQHPSQRPNDLPLPQFMPRTRALR